MFDISYMSDDELQLCETDYLIRKCCEDIEDFYYEIPLEDRVKFASALHRLILQFNPNY